MVLGFFLTVTCVNKTSESMNAIPYGYDVVKIKNDSTGSDHMFLLRRDFKLARDPRVIPMYLLSGLGLGTILLGARVAFKIRRS